MKILVQIALFFVFIQGCAPSLHPQLIENPEIRLLTFGYEPPQKEKNITSILYPYPPRKEDICRSLEKIEIAFFNQNTIYRISKFAANEDHKLLSTYSFRNIMKHGVSEKLSKEQIKLANENYNKIYLRAKEEFETIAKKDGYLIGYEFTSMPEDVKNCFYSFANLSTPVIEKLDLNLK